MTVKDFSERLGVMRPNVYRIFSAQSIDTNLLWQICVILNYNFFEHYAQLLQESLKEKPQNPGIKQKPEKLVLQNQ